MTSLTTPPTGTVTFLFTDIEGSTRRWEAHPQQMERALARHDAILRRAIEGNGGYVFKTVGDAFCAAFPTALGALEAALQAQLSLIAEPWDEPVGAVRVRMALHVGAATLQDGDYFGQPLNRVARILSAGHGGQVLLSDPTFDLVRDNLPAGVNPTDLGEHRLKDLYRPERIFQLTAPGLPSEFPPLRTLDNLPNDLPVQLTPFIGREKEVLAVCTLLRRDGVHLVTLTGSGGTGKTRLGLQVAVDLLDEYSDGVWLVELAALTDPGLVTSTIAQVLGAAESTEKPLVDALKEHLKEKQLLLLLDNFEQVADAAAVVTGIVKSAPAVKVLVTSRVKLNVYGEHEYAVSPLSMPDVRRLPPLEKLTQYEAVRLFVERAQAAKADFEVTNDNAPAVAEICARLDGLPLAIELAAVRVKMLPPQALLSRLSSRLRVLTGGNRDLPARQQTLRNAIEWSYDLLDEGERQLFRRMAVFQGGRTLEALERVCNYDGASLVDPFDGVQSLIDKSLLQQREGEGGEPRYWMLETIHEYAREKLQESGEADEMHRQHALYFLALAEEVERHQQGPQGPQWFDRLENELDNMRAALTWGQQASQASDRETALRLALSSTLFWASRGYRTEGRNWIESLLPISKATSPALHARALSAAGGFANAQGDNEHARTLLEASLDIYTELGDKPGVCTTLVVLGSLASIRGDFGEAKSLGEESLRLNKELGNEQGIAQTLDLLGSIAWQEGDYETAGELYSQSIPVARRLGNRGMLASVLTNMAAITAEQGNTAAARPLFDEALTIFREDKRKGGITVALSNLARIACWEGDFDKAEELANESMTLAREMRFKSPIMWLEWTFAEIALARGGAVRAARLMAAAEALRETTGEALSRFDQADVDRIIGKTRAQLDESKWDKAWQEGRAMSMDSAIEYALEGTPGG